MSGRVWRYVPFIVWPAVTAIALLWRVPLAIDETRYLTVAWEMFSSGDWILPQLNGATYSHKPPLLFWLIALGWQGLGVNEWWPRLVPALTGLASWLVYFVLFPFHFAFLAFLTFVYNLPCPYHRHCCHNCHYYRNCAFCQHKYQ